MLTLSQASKDTKQILKWGLISIVSLIVLMMVFKALLFVKETLFPTPPPRPTVAFGKLPQIVFPVSTSASATSYAINTLSGDLPVLPNQVKIFRMQIAPPDLLALQKTTEKVAKLGFTAQPIAASDTTFQWTGITDSSSSLAKNISFDITNDNFSLTSDFMHNQTILNGDNLPNQSDAIAQAKGALGDLSLITDDLNLDGIESTLLTINNGTLIAATSLSKTQVIKVDFPQKDINKLPVYYEKPDTTNISFLIAGGESQAQIVQANYIHQIPTNESATYPIKTAKEAYGELKQGKAYIAAYSGSGNVTINNALLAYYIGSKTQNFLTPIIVFTGSDGFIAYVSAITDEWTNK